MPPGVPTLASSPALEAEEVWLSTVAPSHSSVRQALPGTHTDTAPGQHHAQEEGARKGVERAPLPATGTPARAEGCTRGQHPAPTPEAAGNYVEPPMTTGATDALGSGQSQSPWAVLTNEVEMPRAGEWGPPGRWDPPGDLREAGRKPSGSLAGPASVPQCLSGLSQGSTGIEI